MSLCYQIESHFYYHSLHFSFLVFTTWKFFFKEINPNFFSLLCLALNEMRSEGSTPFPSPVILAAVAMCTLPGLPVPKYEIKEVYGKVVLENSAVSSVDSYAKTQFSIFKAAGFVVCFFFLFREKKHFTFSSKGELKKSFYYFWYFRCLFYWVAHVLIPVVRF